ncbi:MAG: translocation/assembly module TamB domain-containing protein [Burkholderiales bacterium]|jgi:translocation and assembly module TamB|nr:translocation/assembly module TamB domain-containing protein [Burkholderiales bacterium]
MRYLPRWLRYTFYTVLTLIVVLIAIAGTTIALLRSEEGRAWLIAQVNKTGIVSLRSLEGNLLDEVTVHDLVYDDAAIRLTLDSAHWRWNLRTALWRNLGHRELSISLLEAGTLTVTSKPQTQIVPKEPLPLPASLTLPLAITVDTLTLQHFSWDKIQIDAIDLSIKSDGSRHLIGLNRLESARGEFYGALGVDGKAPFLAGGIVSYRGRFEEHPVGFDLNIDGTLRDFHLNGHVFGDNMNVESDGRFNLFAPYVYSMLHEVTLRTKDLNPAKIFPGLPEGSFAVALDVKPQPGQLARGTLKITNAMAGAADRRRIPIEALTSEFEVQEDQIAFYELNVAALGGAKIEGQGWLREDQLRARLVLNNVNAQALASAAPKSKVSGEIWLQGPYRAPEVTADVTEALTQAAAKFGLAWVDPSKRQQLAVKDAQIKYHGATAKFAGQYDLESQALTAQGKFDNVDPAAFGASSGQINGDFNVDGALSPSVDVRARTALRSSRWLAQTMTGEGEAQWANGHLQQVKAWLQLSAQQGTMRLIAEGAFGKENDALRFDANVSDLAQWGNGAENEMKGRAQVSGELRGTFSNLALRAQAQTDELQIGETRAQQARVTVDTHWDETLTAEMLPFNVHAEMENIEAGNTKWQTVTLELSGTPAKHQATLTARGKAASHPADVAATANGHWDDSAARWQGALSHFEVKHQQLPIRLKEPLPIVVEAATESVKVNIGASVLVANDSRVRLKNATWQAGRWRSEGAIENVDVAQWLKRMGNSDAAATVRGDLVLSGGWSFSQEREALSALQGYFDIHRERGDAQVRVTSRAVWQPLHLSQLGMRAEIKNAQLTLKGIMESERYGKIEVDGETALTATEKEMNDRPFTLRVQSDVPDLSKFATLIGGDIQLTGRLHLDAQHAGTLRHPVYRGAMTGDALSLQDKGTGVALSEGEIRLALNEQNITIERFTLKGGRGEMAMTGGIDLQEGKPRAKLAIKADRFRLIRRPDMVLVVTGNADLGYDEQGVSLLGNLKADYGSIQYRDSDVPGLSDDVVVVGEESQEASVNLANVQFDVDLGNNFRFRGYGIDTKLAGTLKLRARPNQALAAFGNVRAEEGIYRAYGQKLEIRRGIISFLGPLDNPTLDILAIREGSSVDAGVAVKGTATRPSVALYSNPSMSTNETLSWLLFDHGTENMDKGDAAILFHLLNNMLAGGSGETLTDELFGGVIDEINVAAGQMEDGTTTQIITVSKRLNKNLSIGLDKSLNGLQDAIRLTWRLSKKWSIMTRFGVDDSTIGARYSIMF